MEQKKTTAREKSIKRIKFADTTWEAIQNFVKGVKGGGLPKYDEEASNLEGFFEAAVSLFVPTKGMTGCYEYISSPKDGEYHCLWLEPEAIKKVKHLASRDKTSENRIIYTAIINYLSNRQITVY